MTAHWYRSILLVAGVALACGVANAQYESDGFESPTYTGSPAGTILTGQDGFYIPGGTNSVDYNCYTYAGNALGVVAHPAGGAEQFVAGVGPGDGTTYARAQRDMAWGTGVWVVTYDVNCLYLDFDIPTNNVGSFSVQPYPGSSDYIHLFSWFDDLNLIYQALFMVYNAGGTLYDQPGISPGPMWDTLVLNHWYQFTTVIDFDLNKFIETEIVDLHTGASDTFVCPADDWYLEGGSGGGLGQPTGFRFFAGGGFPGNCMAWDNASVLQEGGCVGDLDGDGVTGQGDLGILLADWGCTGNCVGDLDGNGETGQGDLGILLADWGCGT